MFLNQMHWHSCEAFVRRDTKQAGRKANIEAAECSLRSMAVSAEAKAKAKRQV